MKWSAAAVGVCVLLSISNAAWGAPKSGYQGTWCAVINLGIGSVGERCGYPSFETCQQDVRVYGTSSFCRMSPGYEAYWGMADPRHPVRKKKRHSVPR